MHNRTFASHHEAAHAVAAYLSTYHGLLGNFSANADGSGDATVRLSRRKVTAAGIALLGAEDHRQVRREGAMIRLVGFAAEVRLASMGDSLADRSMSGNDYMEAERLIGQVHVEEVAREAGEFVESQWDAIADLAIVLEERGVLDSVDVLDILNLKYGRNEL